VAKIKVLLKDGKFAGYEPRKNTIKETITRKSGKEPTEENLNKIYNKRLKDFLEMPKKNSRFEIVTKEKR
jgi:hypothetical protein